MIRYIYSIIIITICAGLALPGNATETADSTAINLDGVTVVKRVSGLRKIRGSATNSEIISASELTRAACCNLGESFTTNPSVDVNYNDAATGARQIKLLGLAGTYVQMLTENIPNFRGSALPYGLGYIAGPWIQSISVSKGTSSVKNGYESITGQINIEMKKPQADREVSANGYADMNGKAEVNANANFHINPRLSTALLVHGENAFAGHDGNHDGFLDMPRVRQATALNRWAYMTGHYVFQGGVRFLNERRLGGQHTHDSNHSPDSEPYDITVRTNRWEAFTKNAYIYNRQNDGNVALILSGTYNAQRSAVGKRIYDVNQANVYASLMWEHKLTPQHHLSAGLSFNYDNYHQRYLLSADGSGDTERDTDLDAASGIYGQYTLNIDRRLLVMAGVRYDYSTAMGSLFTPRLHLRWNPTDAFTMHASAGRGFRHAHPLAENSYALATSRRIVIDSNLHGEEAWNFGIGTGLTLHVADKPLSMNAEYYYTHFVHQMLVDFDSDPSAIHFKNLNGRSFSHTFQFDVTYPLLRDFTLTAAYRLNNVKVDYGNGLTTKPLTPHHKGLLTAGYSPMMGLWQFDVTCALTGASDLPAHIALPDDPATEERPRTFAQLNAQITRNFRHWAVYIGGENLTGFRQKHPVFGAANPYAPGFDATMAWGPTHGAIIYVGFRYTYNRY